jgi:probable phosphoglycerate mutase
MAIGTSAGEYFEDAFEHSASRYNAPITGDNQQMKAPVEEPEAAKLSIIRHGETDYNGETASADLIRGHTNVPLNKRGIEQAHAMGKKLPKDITGLYTSDLDRAHDTAKIISEESGVPIIESSRGFRPWDVGKFGGQPSKTAVPKLIDYMENKPDEPVPGGESFNQFKDRALSNIQRAQEENPGEHIGIVSHHRVDRLVAGLNPKTGEIDPKVFGQKGEPPGSITTHEFKIAGDVVPMQPREQYLITAGPTDKSAPYAWGLKKDPDIKPMPMATTQEWMERTSSRR